MAATRPPAGSRLMILVPREPGQFGPLCSGVRAPSPYPNSLSPASAFPSENRMSIARNMVVA